MPISFDGGEFVLGRGELNYGAVLEDFKKARIVRVLTYNISKKNYRNELIKALKEVSESSDVKIITNIPSRMKNYYNNSDGNNMRNRYKETYTAYLARLNPEKFKSNPEVAFNFTNHAKIIGTENIVYVGSANYSDESKDNIESGTLIRDKDFIKKLYEEVFPVILEESTPYFDDNYNVFRLFLLSIISKLRSWVKRFDTEIIWGEDAIRGIYEPIALDEEDLVDLYDVIDESDRFEVLIEETYSEEDEEYNDLVETLKDKINEIDIKWMLDFVSVDSELYECVVFDEDERINYYIQEDSEAYDENLNEAVERAMGLAREEGSALHGEIESGVFVLYDCLTELLDAFQSAHDQTLKFSEKWIAAKIDNT